MDSSAMQDAPVVTNPEFRMLLDRLIARGRPISFGELFPLERDPEMADTAGRGFAFERQYQVPTGPTAVAKTTAQLRLFIIHTGLHNKNEFPVLMRADLEWTSQYGEHSLATRYGITPIGADSARFDDVLWDHSYPYNRTNSDALAPGLMSEIDDYHDAVIAGITTTDEPGLASLLRTVEGSDDIYDDEIRRLWQWVSVQPEAASS